MTIASRILPWPVFPRPLGNHARYGDGIDNVGTTHNFVQHVGRNNARYGLNGGFGGGI